MASLTSFSIAFGCLAIAMTWLFQHGSSQSKCTDTRFFSLPSGVEGEYEPPGLFGSVRHESFRRKSIYLPMSDGVQLAMDIYLPPMTGTMDDDDDDKGESYPTFLHLTRYRRAEKCPLIKYISLFGEPKNKEGYLPVRSLQYLQTFVTDGYALVSVDVRGTGASYGSRPIDLADREVKDYVEVLEWVKKQSWCNGKIGTGGISYDGLTGALMAANAKDAKDVQAVAMMFVPGDIYEDIGAPGGILNSGFLEWYEKFTAASERNIPVKDPEKKLPASFRYLSTALFRGSMPVDSSDKDSFQTAISQHENNFDMYQGAINHVKFKDSVILHESGKKYTLSMLGITKETCDGLLANEVAVYSLAGYYDSGSIRSAARLHNYLLYNGGDSKLTIGPWTHGARAAWTPNSTTSTKTSFPLVQDIKRFFDCKLRDQCGEHNGSGFNEEPPLTYFLSGRDEWRTGNTMWPPDEGQMKLKRISLDSKSASNFQVVPSPRGQYRENRIEYVIDFSATSGFSSRWNLVQHVLKQPVTYPDRANQILKTLSFSLVTQEDYAIVGSVRVTIFLQLENGAFDTAVFAYLDDINPLTGDTNYITEGSIRPSHRTTDVKGVDDNTTVPSLSRIGGFDSISRSYLGRDWRPLEESVVQVDFLLEPVGYVVPKGHVLRLSLAGADNDNYYLENIDGLATKWYLDPTKSEVHLPLLEM